jgi:hypothetical protein
MIFFACEKNYISEFQNHGTLIVKNCLSFRAIFRNTVVAAGSEAVFTVLHPQLEGGIKVLLSDGSDDPLPAALEMFWVNIMPISSDPMPPPPATMGKMGNQGLGGVGSWTKNRRSLSYIFTELF